MSGWEIFLGIILGLIVNETCDLSPWAAKKLVQWSARMRYTDPQRAETRAVELVSLIEERPGKLFKLCTALGFSATTLAARTQKAFINKYLLHEERIHEALITLMAIKAAAKTSITDLRDPKIALSTKFSSPRKKNPETEKYWNEVFRRMDRDISSSIERYLPKATQARVRELLDMPPVDKP